MKKLIFGLLLFISAISFGQSGLYNNAVYNIKDPRNTSIYKFHYLNNTDSIFSIDSVGIKFIRAGRFKGWNTAGRPAFAVAGMIGYNTDSSKLEFYNGSGWGSLAASTSSSYTAGSGLTLTGTTFKYGGTITENTTLNTGGTYTWSLTDGTTPMIHSDANERVSIKGTNNAGNQFYVNGTFGAADGSVLFSFASASLQYYCPSSDMIIRLNGQGEEWRFAKSGNAFDIYPVTTNADPLRFRDNANGDILSIIPSNRTVAIYAMPAATSSDLSLVVRGSSDSALRQLAFPGGTSNFLRADGTFAAPSGSSYTFTNGLTNSSGTVSLGGAFPNSTTQITGGGASSAFYLGGGSGLSNTTIEAGTTQIIGAFATTGTHLITSGTSATVNNDVSRVVINPGSVLATYTLTLSSTPVDGEEIQIFFGGTIAGGATVVTSLTISANSGQTLMQPTTPSTAVGGDCIIYKYYSNNSTWYRVK